MPKMITKGDLEKLNKAGQSKTHAMNALSNAAQGAAKVIARFKVACNQIKKEENDNGRNKNI